MKRIHLAACVLVLAALAIVGTASADYCVRGHAIYGHQTYAAPTYNYGYGYQQPYYQPQYVPYAVPYHYNPEYYYSTDTYYQFKIVEAAFNFAKSQQPSGGGKQPAPAPVNPPGQVQPVSPPTPQPPAPKIGLRTAVAPELVKSIETNGCMRCHAPAVAAKSGADLSLDLESLATMGEGMRWKMHGLVSSGDMPKGGKAVPDGEMKLYYDHAMAFAKMKIAAK